MNDQDLVNKLHEHAEWARANEWETPITLGDDLAEAAERIEAQAKEIEKLRGQLKANEDTGLTPQEVLSMKFEWCAMMDALNSIGGGYTRLRELAKADNDGRVVVLPCKVGDKLYRVFAGEIFEHKVRNMRYLAIQGRWDIDTTPFCSYVESSIGKTIFLTHEQAEKALEEMKDVCP